MPRGEKSKLHKVKVKKKFNCQISFLKMMWGQLRSDASVKSGWCLLINLLPTKELSFLPRPWKSVGLSVFTKKWLSNAECDEYIQIFEYIGHEYIFRHSFVSIFLLRIYSDIRSCQICLYEYIQTFVRVKFVCTNIFGHSLVSVLECKT